MKKVVVVMKPILVFLSFFALALTAKGKQDTTYYRQAVTLENTAWFSFVVKNGVIAFKQDSVIFDCKKRNGKFSFSFAYSDIRNVRRYSYLWAMLPLTLLGWPESLSHGVKIETKNGDYYFFTFKRKKIMELIRSKIAK
ncbi:MAG: hypothetical protein CRN43_16310 [Candidatus Nephrothrix sp. EaCA]|nr:MAG: hypothetical protein CRN43_16310 [Candidatus Nephrothrix sp. EaCA]